MSTIPNLNTSPGNTPLDTEELEQLIPSLATKGELDEWERKNILEANEWALKERTLKREDPLTEAYLRELHKRMFDQTWKWAGQYRNTEKNFGCLVPEIRDRIGTLLDDARYWFEHNTFSVDERAIRIHHRLVGSIHPFPNGNGRHARLLADVVAVKFGQPEFSWGSNDIVAEGTTRAGYLEAL